MLMVGDIQVFMVASSISLRGSLSNSLFHHFPRNIAHRSSCKVIFIPRFSVLFLSVVVFLCFEFLAGVAVL